VYFEGREDYFACDNNIKIKNERMNSNVMQNLKKRITLTIKSQEPLSDTFSSHRRR